MRVLIFCDEDLSASSGGDRQVLGLAHELAGLSHAVRIVAPSPQGGRERNWAAPNLAVRFVPVVRVPGLRPLSYLIGSALALWWEFRQWRPQVLLWFDSPGQFAPGLCARMSACPYVLFVNGLPEEELNGIWRWAPIRRLLMQALKRAVGGGAAVVSVCEEILVRLREASGRRGPRWHVIKNGVNPQLFCPHDAGEARAALGLDPARPVVGFVGGFFPWHGLDTLIEAVPFVLRDVPKALFLLVGDGQARPDLEAKVQQMGIGDAVEFPGRVRYQEVPRWIAACDLCVVLHRPLRSYPGDPMKLWEYLSCGRPVVATAGPGYGDPVEALGCGFAVKPGDPEDLARAIVRLLGDPDLAARMGSVGRDAVVKAHTWRARALSLESVLAEAVRETTSVPLTI